MSARIVMAAALGQTENMVELLFLPQPVPGADNNTAFAQNSRTEPGITVFAAARTVTHPLHVGGGDSEERCGVGVRRGPAASQHGSGRQRHHSETRSTDAGLTWQSLQVLADEVRIRSTIRPPWWNKNLVASS